MPEFLESLRTRKEIRFETLLPVSCRNHSALTSQGRFGLLERLRQNMSALKLSSTPMYVFLRLLLIVSNNVLRTFLRF